MTVAFGGPAGINSKLQETSAAQSLVDLFLASPPPASPLSPFFVSVLPCSVLLCQCLICFERSVYCF